MVYYNFNGTHNYIVIVMWRLNGGAPPLLVCPLRVAFILLYMFSKTVLGWLGVWAFSFQGPS